MAQDVFAIKVNNVWKYYNVAIPEDGIERDGEVLDGEGTTRYQSGIIDRDIIGTFYNYTIQINTNNLSTSEYDELFELLSSPVYGHDIKVPYGQSTLQFKAYITKVKDKLRYQDKNGVNHWHDLSLQFIATAPART